MFVNNIVLFLKFGGNCMKNPLDSIWTLVAGVILTIVFVYLLKTFFKFLITY